MQENQQDDSEVLETTETETEAVETTEVQEEKVELTAAEVKELREKAAKTDDLEKKNKQLFARAKKAAEAQDGVLPTRDVLALTRANIDPDDFEEVVEFASYRKLSVADALSNKTLKTILLERAEERQTANATQTRSARSTSQVTGETLLAKASRGEDVEDVDKLAAARMDFLRSKKR